MKYRLTIKERLDGNEVEYQSESEDVTYLKGQFDMYVMAESMLAELSGWETDEWENKRGWFFEAYDTDRYAERNTLTQLVVVLD